MSIKHALAAGAVTALALVTAASAHPALRALNPPANGIVSNTLKDIRLTFSEAVIPVFSGVTLTDRNGKAVALGAPHQDSKSKNVLVVPLKSTLADGKYQIAWHAVANDTHRVEGMSAFSVKK